MSLWLLPGLVALVAEPIAWLARTWMDPMFESQGAWVAALCAGLAARSVWSGRAAEAGAWGGKVMALLLGAAGVRLAGRLLDVNVLGAAALSLDVWALGLGLRLGSRPWPVRPAALAALFAMSLPVERLIQRLAGYPLRVASAVAAKAVLGSEVRREGTLLVMQGGVLDVDAPCSGVRGLFLLGVLALALACRRRMGVGRWLGLGAGVVAATLLTNVLRLVLLFLGQRLGWPVWSEPMHTTLGLIALAAGARLVLLLLNTREAPKTHRGPGDGVSWRGEGAEPLPSTLELEMIAGRRAPPAPGKGLAPSALPGIGRFAPVLFSLGAVAVAVAPHRPVDVSRTEFSRRLPSSLGLVPGLAIPLDGPEQAYFKSFGGFAEKRIYGSTAVLLVTTSAPLRHLHEPADCLLGAGYTLERMASRSRPFPTVTWRATGPDGRLWRAEVSFFGERGRVTATLQETLWQWLRQRDARSAIERISPWSLCEATPRACLDFERKLFNTLDLQETLP